MTPVDERRAFDKSSNVGWSSSPRGSRLRNEAVVLNSLYLLLLTSAMLNFTEHWGGGKDKRSVCMTDSQSATEVAENSELQHTMRSLLSVRASDSNTISQEVISIFLVAFCTVFLSQWPIKLACLASSLFFVGRDFPMLSNHSNVYLYLGVATLTYSCLWLREATRPDKRLPVQVTRSSSSIIRLSQVMGGGLALVYIAAGFHKLNYDFNRGCAVNFLWRFLDRVFPSLLQLSSSTFLVRVIEKPVVYNLIGSSVVLWELFNGCCLFIPPLAWLGVLGAFGLHMLLSLITFYDFSSVALPVIYLVTILSTGPAKLFSLRGKIKIPADENAVMYATINVLGTVLSYSMYQLNFVHYDIQSSRGLIFVGSAFILLRKVWENRFLASSRIHLLPRRKCDLIWLAAVLLFAITPYLGLRTAGTFTMFSNLRTEGPLSNHILLGTNQLKFFGYQEDRIHIQRMPPSDIVWRGMPCTGQDIPLVQFQSLMYFHSRLTGANGMRRSEFGPVEIVYRGKQMRIENVYGDEVFAPRTRTLEMFFFAFRAVDNTPIEVGECRW